MLTERRASVSQERAEREKKVGEVGNKVQWRRGRVSCQGQREGREGQESRKEANGSAS